MYADNRKHYKVTEAELKWANSEAYKSTVSKLSLIGAMEEFEIADELPYPVLRGYMGKRDEVILPDIFLGIDTSAFIDTNVQSLKLNSNIKIIE